MLVFPYMASLIRKKKRNKFYYYLAHSARVHGKPRIVRQIYLGTAERVAALVKANSTPQPLDASVLDFGLPAALWQAARRSGAFDALLSVWPRPRKGPSTSHYLLLAAIHRICSPGPKTRVSDWYRRTALPRLWGFPAAGFSSQAFWDCFDRIDIDPDLRVPREDELEQAQAALLDAFCAQGLAGPRVLAYDTTNFHTWTASTNRRSHLARRGRNKQRRHDLRQVGLSYALDGQHGLSLCHHVYPGNVADSDELPCALQRVARLLDHAGIARDSVTLVTDKGATAFANTQELAAHGLGWITALPWNQAPPTLRSRPVAQLQAVGPEHPGVRAAAARAEVHGGERLCVVAHSSSFAAEQLHSAGASLARATQALRRIARELARPRRPYQEQALRRRLDGWLEPNFVSRSLSYELQAAGEGWRLNYAVDSNALGELLTGRFGRTTLVTNRLDWTAGQVVAAYAGQQLAEQVFRGLKAGDWVGWGPMFHWTDSKIRVHAFYCLLGVSLLQYLRRQAETVWPGLSIEELKRELGQMQQIDLLYPRQGAKGPPRALTVMTKRTLVQKSLSDALGLEELLPGTGG